MNQDISRAILTELYRYRFEIMGATNVMEEVRRRHGWDLTEFHSVADSLCEQGHIRSWGGGPRYELTVAGVFHAEKNVIPSDALIQENHRVRMAILSWLQETRDQVEPNSREFYTRSGLEDRIVCPNLMLLRDLGCVMRDGLPRITNEGLKKLKRWQAREVFDEMLQLSPQERGHALEELLAEILSAEGWSVEKGVRTANEQIDIVFSRDQRYYLLEAKWQRQPVGAAVVREVYGKLAHRVDVRGVVLSMSGFSVGAVDQARECLGTRVILLFGPKDTRAIVLERETFDALLNAKYKCCITRRKILHV